MKRKIHRGFCRALSACSIPTFVILNAQIAACRHYTDNDGLCACFGKYATSHSSITFDVVNLRRGPAAYVSGVFHENSHLRVEGKIMTLAMQLTKFLGGQWYQSYGTVACPVCQPERRRDQNALTLTDGGKGLLVHCKKSECDFRSIMMAVGMSEIRSQRIKPEKSDILAQREAVEFAASVRRAHWAMRTWHEAVPIRGTIAEAYLKSRGISCEMPTSLRYHAACWHGPTKKFYPAMVGLVEGCESTSIHRTFLRPDGSGQAPIKPSKLILGKAKGGAVRLTPDSDHLLVAEGIETALSLASGLLPTPMSIWAALSTSGMRGLELPRTPGLLTIASDGDAAGELAASVLAERAHASGWKVFMLPAPAGQDWNDVLREKGASQ